MADTPQDRIFEYAVIFHPTDDQRKDGAKSKLLVQPVPILAKDAAQAAMLAARAIPEEYEDRLDQVEIGVRPF